jgi:hypothetical protein
MIWTRRNSPELDVFQDALAWSMPGVEIQALDLLSYSSFSLTH